MIGYIQGKVLFSDGKKAVLLTNSGIGYEINYGYFLQADTDVGLYTHHHITDNDQSLWGFNNLEDKKMFELLKTVNKVGSSKAYPLITNIGINTLSEAIKFEQVTVLTKAPGIGKKMAEQIILSLKDKIDTFFGLTSEADAQISVSIEKASTPNDEERVINKELFQEALMALESLGYKDSDITNLVHKNIKDGAKTTEDLLKKVLKEL
jgi:Holliday junction DNA helicase RuvA